MPSSGKPKCLIAAGGTAGHVLPALAVAESLRTLGAEVTFASNADSRQVRDAGYELDVFGVEGFPREVSVRLAKALGRAAAGGSRLCPDPAQASSRRRPRRRRLRRRADGARSGQHADPRRTHRGGRPPRAREPSGGAVRRRSSSSPIRSRASSRRSTRSSAGRSRRARSRATAVEARRRFELPEEGPVVLVFGGSQGAQRLNEAALEAFGARGPAVLHLAGRARLSRARGAGRAPRLPAASVHRRLRRRARRGRPRRCARGRLGLGDRRGRHGRRCSSRTRTRPPTTRPRTPATSSAAEARSSCPEPELDLRRQVEELLADPERLTADGEAMKSLARPDAADDIAKELLRLAS